MGLIGFDEYIPIRIKSDEKNKILRIVKKNKFEFQNNASLFVRSAIIRFLREYDRRGNRIKS